MNETISKRCNRCGVEKEIKEFSKDKLDNYYNVCNKCKEYNRIYRLENKEKRCQYNLGHHCENKEYYIKCQKEYYLKNKKKIEKYRNEYRIKNKEKVKEQSIQYNKKFYHKNKQRERARLQKYCLENKDKIRKYKNKKYYSDMSYRILQSLRTRVRDVFKGNSKSQNTLSLLGCSILEFRNYLCKNFIDGMTWDNYGRGIGKWNVDHIIPCAIFNFTDPSEQKQCFHFSNMRPLWERGSGGNLEKNDRTDGLKLMYNDSTTFK